MDELNKSNLPKQKSSTAWTFCCLVLWMNYAICIYIVLIIAILLKYVYTVFIGIINIYCCIYTCILLSLVIFFYYFL